MYWKFYHSNIIFNSTTADDFSAREIESKRMFDESHNIFLANLAEESLLQITKSKINLIRR